MRVRPSLASALVLAASLAGCGDAANSGFGPGRGSTDGGAGGGTGGPLIDAGDPDAEQGTDDCAASARLVYVITEQNQLFSLDPSKLPADSAFAPIGVVSCPAAFGATPFSMAVERDGTAWSVFSDGTLWAISTKDASCKPTSFAPGQSGFTTFGMGFVSDTAGSSAETLYVARSDTGGLGKIDLQTMTVAPVGALDPGAELTGTGDGRLFAFFMKGGNATIDELNKSTGAILSVAPQSGVDVGVGWAFAFWGGSFWMFTAPFGASQVTQFDPVAKTTQVVKQNLAGTIVGAGVSTCAPTAPPH